MVGSEDQMSAAQALLQVPALFTFGLSIPIGAGIGLVAGAATGGGAGAVGGTDLGRSPAGTVLTQWLTQWLSLEVVPLASPGSPTRKKSRGEAEIKLEVDAGSR